MATRKRYYWMKLKENFMASDTIDYFMSQPNGANYVVLYQMLCLKTINTSGRLSRQIGEIIIPYDAEKIQRDCKWFSIDTIRVALKLYQAVGLIYEDVDGTLVLVDHENLVGSESDAAARMRNSRANRNAILPPSATDGAQSANIVTPDIDIDNRDKSLDTDTRVREREYRGGAGENKPPASDGRILPPKEFGAAAPAPVGGVTRHKYGEYGWVRLSDEEYDRLLNELGEAELTRCITYVDESAQSNGNKNKWKDWNLVIRKCARDRWGISKGGQQAAGQRPSASAGAVSDLQALHEMFGEDSL